jgi:hypothetical protein
MISRQPPACCGSQVVHPEAATLPACHLRCSTAKVSSAGMEDRPLQLGPWDKWQAIRPPFFVVPSPSGKQSTLVLRHRAGALLLAAKPDAERH